MPWAAIGNSQWGLMVGASTEGRGYLLAEQRSGGGELAGAAPLGDVAAGESGGGGDGEGDGGGEEGVGDVDGAGARGRGDREQCGEDDDGGIEGGAVRESAGEGEQGDANHEGGERIGGGGDGEGEDGLIVGEEELVEEGQEVGAVGCGVGRGVTGEIDGGDAGDHGGREDQSGEGSGEDWDQWMARATPKVVSGDGGDADCGEYPRGGGGAGDVEGDVGGGAEAEGHEGLGELDEEAGGGDDDDGDGELVEVVSAAAADGESEEEAGGYIEDEVEGEVAVWADVPAELLELVVRGGDDVVVVIGGGELEREEGAVDCEGEADDGERAVGEGGLDVGVGTNIKRRRIGGTWMRWRHVSLCRAPDAWSDVVRYPSL